MSTSLALREFDPRNMKHDRLCLFLGRRGTGKSVAMMDLMFHLRREFDMGVVMSGTEASNQSWGQFVPETFIYDSYKGSVVGSMCKKQIEDIGHARDSGGGTVKPVFLVLEDVLYDRTINTDEALRWVFMNGRHAKMFTIISMQYYASMRAELRSQIDYVFLTRQTSHVIKESMWKHFGGIVPELSLFCKILDRATENYGLLVLDQTSISNKLEDCMFWYRAKPDHEFKLGSKMYWEFHYANRAEKDSRQRQEERIAEGATHVGPVDHVALVPAMLASASWGPSGGSRQPARHTRIRESYHSPASPRSTGDLDGHDAY